MRICYIADAASIHTQRWVNFFARRGHEIHLISPNIGDSYVEGVRFHLLSKTMSSLPPIRYLSLLPRMLRVRRLLKMIQPDVVDAHYIAGNGYLGVASGFHPIVLTAWGSDILIHPKRILCGGL